MAMPTCCIETPLEVSSETNCLGLLVKLELELRSGVGTITGQIALVVETADTLGAQQVLASKLGINDPEGSTSSILVVLTIAYKTACVVTQTKVAPSSIGVLWRLIWWW